MTTGFIKAADRDAWLAERRKGIGASDAAAILGASSFKSAYQVWAAKVHGIEDDLSGNEAVEFGIRLEPTVAEAYAARTGRRVAMWPQHVVARHPAYDWMRCTPDATQFDELRSDGLLQVKTTSAYNAADWRDEPPLEYQIQLQAELEVTGHDWGTLVCLIGGQRLRYFDVDRNQRFIDAMIPRLAEFWRGFVETGTPPPVDGSFTTGKILGRLHPDDTGETVILPPDASEWTATIEQCKAEIKQLEALQTDAENRIKAALGDATFGILPDGSLWRWKTQDKKGYEVKPSKCRVLLKLKK